METEAPNETDGDVVAEWLGETTLERVREPEKEGDAAPDAMTLREPVRVTV